MKNILFFLLSISFYSISAQSTTKPLNVYIDCKICDRTMIKQELKNVAFVRDQKDSDVHVFFTTQRNANGGKAYEIEFIGKNDYSDFLDNLSFDTDANMTDLEVTNKILKYLRLGLMRYWIKNGLVEQITLSIKDEDNTTKKEVIDRWNKWSFRIGGNGWFNGQESYKSHNLNFFASGKQITDENKFKFRIGISQNKSIFIYDEDEIISTKKSKYFHISDVISINNHWSAGVFARSGNSVYNNYEYYVGFRPGVEYNLFPYSESAKKQLVINYKVGARFNNYYDTTIFNQDEELLWNQSLLIGTSFKQKWGSISGEIEYENYLHDMSLDGLNISLNTRIRVFKGLSLNLFGGYEISHNQINLSAEGATLEETLLLQRQLRSGYNYWASVGLSYSFGSIYNTVVNSRFDY
jgi:hypothetical protein